ncbi:MAG: hypothetical protein QOI90_2291, partial [Mycobacterium sp.]|nr:hypothetical protein [Mycobacterium sp.]
ADSWEYDVCSSDLADSWEYDV